jgi:hypothetical protein
MNPPVLKVDFKRGCDCGNVEPMLLGLDDYIGKHDSLPPILSAVIPLNKFYSHADYRLKCKVLYKGAIMRNMAKAEPFFCTPFEWANHIPDVVEINHSKEVRCGGKMRPSYLRTVEEMGGAPKEYKEFILPSCRDHWRITWGVFETAPNHKQGEITLNGRLLGYVSMVRIKDLALYAMILGHGDYLKYGIMYKLHFYIMQFLVGGGSPFIDGIKVLMYAAWESGGKGLKLWKKKTLFEPMYLVEA